MEKKFLEKEEAIWHYICNTCFKSKEECKCTNADKSSLGIDKDIIKIIQLLHEKNYQTLGCCQGHCAKYVTEKGNVYSTLSPTYISFDIASKKDMEKELKKLNDADKNTIGVVMEPFRKMENERYQLVVPGIKKGGDSFDFFVQKRNERLSFLENWIKGFKVRTKTEPTIKTYY